MSNSSRRRPIIFGEVLFDQFPDGKLVLGGAPFNVARHLHGFGVNPLFMSRVGQDKPGEKVLAAMAAWGMDTAGIQIDPQRPTGRVEIRWVEGEPAYDILPSQAYDAIELEPALSAMVSSNVHDVIYHGTLALRELGSANTLSALRDRLAAKSFVDINLRPPWWNLPVVEAVLSQAHWAKLNVDELRQIMGEPALSSQRSPIALAQQLREKYHLQLLIVTLGAQGAIALSTQQSWQQAPTPIANIVDTVGAGDAFSAIALLGWLKQWPIERWLAHAVDFAAMVCQTKGAVIPEPSIYEEFLQQWN